VPTTEDIDSASVDDCLAKLSDGVGLLTAKGIDEALIRRQMLLTPSCGAGSISEPQAHRVFELLAEVKRALSAKGAPKAPEGKS